MIRYALALVVSLFLAAPATAQWGNLGVQVVVPAPGGGGISVGYTNGYYNPGGFYNAGYYNGGYYNPGCNNVPGYNPGYYNGGYYGGYYNQGGFYNAGYRPGVCAPNGGFTTYNRYPYTPYPSWGGRGRCR